MGPRTGKNEAIIDGKDVSSPKTTNQETVWSDRRLGRAIRGLLVRAVLWFLAFGVAHLLGFRAFTSFLLGTADFGLSQRLFGAVYLVLCAAFVLLVPILLIASGLMKGAALTIGLWMRANKPDGSSTDAM
ncbi:MAG: hypothetical protein GTN81_04875 [Proteobacteria bacterium]|nr:hypothetical protein [Pseudomonadota bacterium]